MDDDNFEEVVNTYKNVLVYFYIPFCSHEKDLTGIFEKAYNKYYKKKAAVKFGKVNAYINKKYSKEL